MSKIAVATITLKVETDLEEWAHEYGLEASEARQDFKEHIEEIVRAAVESWPFFTNSDLVSLRPPLTPAEVLAKKAQARQVSAYLDQR